MQLHIQSVSELTRSIAALFDENYRFVHIHGEISNMRSPFSGHLYFTLKDSSAQLKAVLFKGQRKFLAEDMKDGQQVICHGRISVYEPRGEYQLVVDTVDFFGTGLLQLRFEQLKQRLIAQGLFSAEHKKLLPAFPQEIIVITSPGGAAIHDFLTICRNRKSSARIRILPVRVQGEGAADEIAAAINRVNRELKADVIVLCRGGGSLEDLWAFNEECVARAIHHSTIPVITGIGHEIDFTIADFCADFRAPTPTGAAERIIPDNIRLLAAVRKLREQMAGHIGRKLRNSQSRVASNRRLLGNLSSVLINASLRMDSCQAGLAQAIQNLLQDRLRACEELTGRLQDQAPLVKIRFRQQRLAFLNDTIRRQVLALLAARKARFAQQMARLHAVSPLATLARGYSIVTKKDASSSDMTIVTDSSQVTIEDQLEIRLHQGQIRCEVIGKN